MTRRQQLIRQLRCTLGELERPELEEETLVFTVADTEFEFDADALNEDLGCNAQ